MADVKPTLPKPPTQPEDEQLSVAPTFDRNQPWAVKIPKFLQEKWEQIKEPGVELGTMVVDTKYASRL
jgi:transcription initiation factor TFIIF subunit beta